MALTFTSAGTQKVDIGHASNITDLHQFTLALWVRQTTANVNDSWMGSPPDTVVATTSAVVFRTSSASGPNIQLDVRQSTSNCLYRSSNSPLILNGWTYIVVTFDDTATPRVHMYSGSLTAIATECTYTTNTDGSGTRPAEATGVWVWANRLNGAATYNRAPAADIAKCWMFNRVLALGEIKALQFRAVPPTGCVNYHELGFNGTSTQPDWSGSGNAGTVTGATQSAHVPLGPMFGYSPMQVPYVVAAAGGTPPPLLMMMGCG